MKNNILILVLTLCCSISAVAQKKTAPLFEFLQKNSDSTIVLSFAETWLGSSQATYIISKKGDTINLLTYKYKHYVAADNGVVATKALSKKIGRVNLEAATSPPDINSYLKLNYLSRDSLQLFWRSLITPKLWTISDDKTDGHGCPVVKGKFNSEIYDGGTLMFKLITKDAIKDLSFYSPNFYDEQCPGREGRIFILKVNSLFETYFNAAREHFGETMKHRYELRTHY